ncbi:MAG: hypothetical protein ACJATT_003926 [Myxococcota bacterium]|jgi:hypothetical protein
MNRLTPLLLTALLTACGGQAETESTGNAQYVESSETADEPARPDGFFLEIRAEGTGTFDVAAPECQADSLTGSFNALYEGEADVNNDGIYIASLTTAEAQTPSGCDLPDLDIGLVTDIVVRGEVQATSSNCSTYCDSQAGAYADTECSGDADEASCRSTAEAEYTSSCTTSCESSTNVIVAETSLTATALTSLDLTALTGAALGTVTADLTFDHIEDDSGETVDEAP